MAQAVRRPGSLLLRHACFSLYALASAALLLFLALDPHVNRPHGLLSLSLFTRRPVSPRAVAGPCPLDPEGSWKIGIVRGTSPLTASLDSAPAITCVSVSNSPAASYVTDPFLVLPRDGPHSSAPWHAFYVVKGARLGRRQLGVAASRDRGAKWQHLGAALPADGREQLSAPWVGWDVSTGQYVLASVAAVQRDGAGAVRVYVTSPEDFPFGWRRHAELLPGHAFLGFAAALHGGRWWALATERTYAAWRWPWFSRIPEPALALRLYYADSLLGDWTQHPLSPVSRDVRFARVGGRPFVAAGRLHRWARDGSGLTSGTGGSTGTVASARGGSASGAAGERLHLFRLDTLSETDYWESWQSARITMEPSLGAAAAAAAWAAAGVRHADVQPVGRGSGNASGPMGLPAAGEDEWYGLVAGDDAEQGGAALVAAEAEARFAGFKATLLRLVAAQLLLSAVAFAAWHHAEWAPLGGGSSAAAAAAMAALTGWWQHCCVGGMRSSHAKRGNGGSSGGCQGPSSTTLWGRIGPELLVAAAAAAALLAAAGGFAAVPAPFCCGRWNVHVEVSLVPPVTHHEAATAAAAGPGTAAAPPPFNVSELVVVTGATVNFFDRTSNMVGSLHAWEPHQRVVVYDLGYSASQLQQMLCWRNVEVRRFPYEEYPPHVADVTNYAFKALVLEHALRSAPAVVWIDAGLELRAPMDTLRRHLAHHGHVSAMQEEPMGSPMYDPNIMRVMVNFFGLAHAFDQVMGWMFCAGGLQGFVRGSDAERLVLRPVANCSLHASQCLAPPGSSRDNHNFDQTAFSIAIWASNFSCLPRETHCMWSVKKASRDPLACSWPIEIISRGHRLPKPYTARVARRDGCPAAPTLPWPVDATRKESLSRHGAWFRLTKVYLQPVGDFFVQALACGGVHVAALTLFWAGLWVLGRWGGRVWALAVLPAAWRASGVRFCWHVGLGTAVLMAVQATLFYLASNAR